MAEIYLALEEMPHAGRRFVTIKRIRSEFARDPDYVEFFLTEGRISLKCAHPNLPQVFELGQVDGSFYLAMEYIRGHTLLDLLRASLRAQQLPSLNAMLLIALQVAAALEHVHGLRDVDGAPLEVIHRDVTPQNIMITADGSVKLIDFGIVRSTVQTHKTQTGIVKGKFAYMAPEQLNGRRDMNQRADLFALGIVMWETLAVRPLFRRRVDFDTIEAVRACEVPEITGLRSDIPDAVFEVVRVALRRKPEKRYQSATDMLTAIESVARSCGLMPSRTDLRKEMDALCGTPDLPQIPSDGEFGESPSSRFAVGSEADAETPAPEVEPPAIHTLPRPSPKSGILRDPLLLYFLRKAGVRFADAPARAPSSNAKAAGE